MTNTIDPEKCKPALHAALEAAAPDGGSYISGENTFWEYVSQGVDPQDAIAEALLKAAPNMVIFREAQDKFDEVYKDHIGLRGIFRGFRNLRDNVRSRVNLT